MKQLKTLGMAAVAVAALMALVGAGTASAAEKTSLCSKEETTNGKPVCAMANQYAAGTEIHAVLEEGTIFSLVTPILTIECAESTIELKTENETAAPLGANVEAFTFAKCGLNNTVTTTANGTLDIEIIQEGANWTHNGTLKFTNTTIQLNRAGLICTYSPADSGVLTGGATGTIDLKGEWPRTGGSPLCGATGGVEGEYEVTKPKPIWVST